MNTARIGHCTVQYLGAKLLGTLTQWAPRDFRSHLCVSVNPNGVLHGLLEQQRWGLYRFFESPSGDQEILSFFGQGDPLVK